MSDRGDGDDDGGDADPEEDPPLRPDIVCHQVLSSEVSREPELQKASRVWCPHHCDVSESRSARSGYQMSEDDDSLHLG